MAEQQARGIFQERDEGIEFTGECRGQECKSRANAAYPVRERRKS